jgi:hypothetical protein
MTNGPEDAYRPAPGRAHLATILFVTEAVVAAVAALTTAMQIQLLDSVAFGGALTQAQAEAYDGRQRLLAVVELAVTVLSLVVFLAWVYRANRNARALGEVGERDTPVWSVGCFFVPLVGLIEPYFALRAIWRASLPGPREQFRAVPASPLLGAWWASWAVVAVTHYSRLGLLFADRGLGVLIRPPEWQADFGAAYDELWLRHLVEFSWGLVIRDIMVVAASALAAAVVISITNMQQRKWAALAGASAPEAGTAP